MEAAARPLPRLDTTPPVTKTYFADIDATPLLNCSDWTYLVGTFKYYRVSSSSETENWLDASSTTILHSNLFFFSGLSGHEKLKTADRGENGVEIKTLSKGAMRARFSRESRVIGT